MYRAVLLDIDGTLIDSNDSHAQAWVLAFAEQGLSVDFPRVRRLIGKGADKLIPELTGIDAESKEGRKLAERRQQIFQRELLPALCPTRGARLLVERLRNDGYILAVATSASPAEVQDLLRVATVDDLVHTASSADGATESKPDPDVIQAALKKARRNASEAMMIGDTPYDIESAARAGVSTIAFRCGGWWSDEELAGAIAIYDDPAELLQNYEYSPLGGVAATRA
jgi:HAD superfamily hydrolase (TIGR01509 family)